MPVSAHDVADRIRALVPGVPAKKLQKLLYLAQGWHLARAREPLFSERIEAWEMGPVVALHWADERHHRERPARLELDGDQSATVDFVVAAYGGWSGKQLEAMTHHSGPWVEVYEPPHPIWGPTNHTIEHDRIRVWFEELDAPRGHAEQVAHLRSRAIYSFDPPTGDEAVSAAVDRALRGEEVRQTRPA